MRTAWLPVAAPGFRQLAARMQAGRRAPLQPQRSVVLCVARDGHRYHVSGICFLAEEVLGFAAFARQNRLLQQPVTFYKRADARKQALDTFVGRGTRH